jgi:uncharacterized protein (TIGR04255 family)
MEQKYVNPPVVEAVCQFRFTSASPWDLTIPGMFYEKIRVDYPIKEQRIIHELIAADPNQKEPVQNLITHELAVFLNPQRTAFIQLGQNILSIHTLQPYPGWSSFLPQIQLAHTHFLQFFEPSGIQRIGLRYINRITLPAEKIQLNQYFNLLIHTPTNLPSTFNDFLIAIIIPVPPDDRCRIQMQSALPDQPKTRSSLLDLDYFLYKPGQVQCEDALSWVENAHQKVETFFEDCITDKLRTTFGGSQ